MSLSPELYKEMVERVGPVIVEEKTTLHEPLLAGLKRATTLRYCTTGDFYKTLMYGFRVASNTISLFVPAACELIY